MAGTDLREKEQREWTTGRRGFGVYRPRRAEWLLPSGRWWSGPAHAFATEGEARRLAHSLRLEEEEIVEIVRLPSRTEFQSRVPVDERTFPLQVRGEEHWPKERRTSLPWKMVASCQRRAGKNHGGQSLETLAARGGLSPVEALALLRDDVLPLANSISPSMEREALGLLLWAASAFRDGFALGRDVGVPLGETWVYLREVEEEILYLKHWVPNLQQDAAEWNETMECVRDRLGWAAVLCEWPHLARMRESAYAEARAQYDRLCDLERWAARARLALEEGDCL